MASARSFMRYGRKRSKIQTDAIKHLITPAEGRYPMKHGGNNGRPQRCWKKRRGGLSKNRLVLGRVYEALALAKYPSSCQIGKSREVRRLCLGERSKRGGSSEQKWA